MSFLVGQLLVSVIATAMAVWQRRASTRSLVVRMCASGDLAVELVESASSLASQPYTAVTHEIRTV
jgi:hypothetical protein